VAYLELLFVGIGEKGSAEVHGKESKNRKKIINILGATFSKDARFSFFGGEIAPNCSILYRFYIVQVAYQAAVADKPVNCVWDTNSC